MEHKQEREEEGINHLIPETPTESTRTRQGTDAEEHGNVDLVQQGDHRQTIRLHEHDAICRQGHGGARSELRHGEVLPPAADLGDRIRHGQEQLRGRRGQISAPPLEKFRRYRNWGSSEIRDRAEELRTLIFFSRE